MCIRDRLIGFTGLGILKLISSSCKDTVCYFHSKVRSRKFSFSFLSVRRLCRGERSGKSQRKVLSASATDLMPATIFSDGTVTKESPMELDKLNRCKAFLKANGVFDKDSFVDLNKED